MPGPMCSICARGIPAIAAARVGFAGGVPAEGVPTLSLLTPGCISAVSGLALACGLCSTYSVALPEPLHGQSRLLCASIPCENTYQNTYQPLLGVETIAARVADGDQLVSPVERRGRDLPLAGGHEDWNSGGAW